MKNLYINFAVITFVFAIFLFAGGTAKADCSWTVTGTVKVQVPSNHFDLINDIGAQIPLKGIKVKVSGATIGWFDEWATVNTDANGKFTVTKQKSCDNRKLKIEVQFSNDSVELRTDAPAIPNILSSGPKWYTIVEDDDRRRVPGTTQILPTVFDAGKNHDLSDKTARDHALVWVYANLVRDHYASYGAKFKYAQKTVIDYPNNDPLISDNKESSFTNPVDHKVNIFRSTSGTEDHLNFESIAHEMSHQWMYEHTSGELDLATNLFATGSTHCFNDKEHISFMEGGAESMMIRLREEIFPKTFPTPLSLPFNRPALKAGMPCEGNTDKIDSMLDMERHEFGWQSLFMMLTTKDLFKYSYGDNPLSSTTQIWLRSPSVSPIGCSNPTNLKLKNVLDAFLAHPEKGFNDNLTKGEMNIDNFLNRASIILGFEEQKTGLKHLLDPTKTTEPKDELCSQPVMVPTTKINIKPKKTN